VQAEPRHAILKRAAHTACQYGAQAGEAQRDAAKAREAAGSSGVEEGGTAAERSGRSRMCAVVVPIENQAHDLVAPVRHDNLIKEGGQGQCGQSHLRRHALFGAAGSHTCR
jgi:hypothetical protein